MTLDRVEQSLKRGYVAGVNARQLDPDDRHVALYYMSDYEKEHDSLYLAFEAGYMGALEGGNPNEH